MGIAGAVVAFNASSCPSGWKPFDKAKGRTIIGAGKGDNLSDRTFGSVGGEEKHILTVDEMHKHTHEFHGDKSNLGAMDMGQAYSESLAKGKNPLEQKYTSSGSISEAGGNSAHENMQPWLALMYCIKQ